MLSATCLLPQKNEAFSGRGLVLWACLLLLFMSIKGNALLRPGASMTLLEKERPGGLATLAGGTAKTRWSACPCRGHPTVELRRHPPGAQRCSSSSNSNPIPHSANCKHYARYRRISQTSSWNMRQLPAATSMTFYFVVNFLFSFAI